MRLTILALLLPLPAAAFTAQNGMTAVQTAPSEITVIHEVRREDTDYWCAAGDLIVFTLDPAKAAPGGGLSQFGSGPRDGSIPVGMAVGTFCRVIVPFFD